MIDYDIDGMDDSKWHNFNVNEDVIVLNEYIYDYPYDQRYGQTVTGGIDTGSQTTSGLHGPSIDASDLGYSFDGWGSRGMEYVYNLVQRFSSLIDGMFNDKHGHPNYYNHNVSEPDNQKIKSEKRSRTRPIVSGQTGDTIGIIIYEYEFDRDRSIYNARDTSIYGIPIEECRKKINR